MKRHLNTLFVTTDGSYLAKDGECVAVRIDGETRARIPVLALDGVVCFGRVSCSPALLAHCADNQVTISHLTAAGRFQARVDGPTRGNVLLRRTQYRWSDDPVRNADLARVFVLAKLHNARLVYRRAQREASEGVRKERLTAAADRLNRLVARAEHAPDTDTVRGIEGEGAAGYWQNFQDLIAREGKAFAFNGRSRRPPMDRVNALLSFLYTILTHDIRSALECVGLDPYVGFLHRDRPGRASLALDMLEEYRPWLVDRLVLSLVNRRQLAANDFQEEASGAILMTEATRKAVLTAWQERKQDTVTHPFLNEKMRHFSQPGGETWQNVR